MLQHRIRNGRPNPHRYKEREFRQQRQKGTVQQITAVSNENLLKYLETRGTGGIEDLSRRISLHVGGGGHLNVSKHVYENTDTECFKATEDISDFRHRRFDDSCGISVGLALQINRPARTGLTVDHILDDQNRGYQGVLAKSTRCICSE